MERIEIDGLEIAYRRVGEGAPLVLLHGGPIDSREWRSQVAGLSDEFTVVAWDMPGCGRSSDPPEHFRTRDYAECLAVFIDGLGLERPHVLGLSFGSGLALELYRWHPDVPRTLILASAYPGWADHDARDVLSRIEVPTLLLYGDKDVRSPRAVAEDLHARIPCSRLVFIPGAGHLCDMEAPERFNAELPLLARVVAPASVPSPRSRAWAHYPRMLWIVMSIGARARGPSPQFQILL